MINKPMQCFINSCLLFLLLISQQSVLATVTDDIKRLISKGQLSQALTLIDKHLVSDKRNLDYLFLKGLVLTKQNKLDQATKIFVKLTEEHPELPEPLNNLAVVYAAQGDFTSARQALQRAINTHPSYATAHENMGDIYAKMASLRSSWPF